MPRNMSFALTRNQIEARTKTVTRRTGWKFLKVGDVLNAVNRTMGFQLGEHPVHLAKIRVKDVRREPLNAITFEDVEAEGLADHPAIQGFPSCFVDFFCRSHKGCTPETEVTRIEFEYV